MYNIIKTYVQKTVIVDGEYKTKIRADIAVSTVDDLPDDDKFLTDSVCYVRKAGAFYTKDDDGNWYDSSGNAPSSASSLNASLSAPKSSAQLGEGKSVLVQPEPTQTETKQPDESEGGEVK